VRDIHDLRLFVLLRHIALEEWLRSQLPMRLAADTLPEQRSFSNIASLALAGTRFVDDREAIGLFAKARNDIAHKMYSSDPSARLARFVGLVSGKSWPATEPEQINAVSEAVGSLMTRITLALEELR
jgi:hypothetical protein